VWNHPILLEDIVVIRICPLDPGDQMLLQKVLRNINVDSFNDANERDRAFLAVAAHSQHHLLKSSLGEGRDADTGVHIGHREARQVAGVGAVEGHIPSKDFFIGKNPNLIRLTAL
jgi:hypothetical protein